MHIEIEHETRYEYRDPVRLGPHVVRLRPRPGGCLRELDYALEVQPAPVERRDCLDANGNRVVRLWFDGETRSLRLHSRLSVETGDGAAYAPRLDAARARVPVLYPDAEAAALAHYLDGPPPAGAVSDLAGELARLAAGDTLAFLDLLNRRLHTGIAREIRPTGAPQTPAETRARGRGACRDQSVLFMAVCRAAGLAARFVSGYQDRSAMETERRYLHAWPEVYLPESGWHGYDPTRGAPAADGHVPLAAARDPGGTMPVEGSYFGETVSRMDFSLAIRAWGADANER
jgi:transglutaminase-like putative cysteine protease